MALTAAAEVLGKHSMTLRDIEFRKAIFLPEGETRTIQTILSGGADGMAPFHIYSCAEGATQRGRSWTLHALGKVCLQQETSGIVQNVEQETLAEIRTRCAETIDGPDYYRGLSENGIHYGSFFQSIARLWQSNGVMLGDVQVPKGPEVDLHGSQIHPAILDAGLQVFGAAVAADAAGTDRRGLYLPTRIDQFRVHGHPGRQLWGNARVRHRDATASTGEIQLFDDAGNVAIGIDGLRFEYLGEDTQRAALANADDWLYEFQWQPKELAAANSSVPASQASWLIFADGGGVGDALSALLEARGERSILVTAGETYEQTDDRHYRVRPERPEDISRVFEAALGSGQPSCRGVVHLWSLDVARPEETTTASLSAAQTLGCGSVLHLVQELARMESPDLPRLWLITRGAQAVGEEGSQLSVAQAPLWGLGRVIAQEHPTFWGGLVDLEPGVLLRDAAAHQLCEEISSADGEDQLAFRQGQRYVGRLVRLSPSVAQAPSFRWRTDASYLISGGLGDLGLLVARWMVEQGARRLILLGRTRLPPRSNWNLIATGTRLAKQITAIRELEVLGASVHLARVDVADEAELRGFIDKFRAEGWPPIRGVVHAAGVLQDGLLVQLDAPALDAVMRPKVMGAWLLHDLLSDEALDFFVLFSSAGSMLGQPGQGNYAAGNAFLDALAHHRQAQGQPALSINWGAWAGEGFADSVGGKRLTARLALLGISGIEPQQALEILGRLLGQSAAQVIAVPVNWKQYREFYSSGIASPLLSELAREAAEVPRPARLSTATRDALLAADPADRQRLLQSYLSEQVARALGLSPSKLDPQQPLSDLGLDSLMAVELKNRIAFDLKVNVPVVKFLQGFSVDQAVTQVLEQLAAEATNPTTPLAPAGAELGAQRHAETLLASLDQLSDEQVSSLLADMLAEEKAGSMQC
jgi:acyl carrier protein